MEIKWIVKNKRKNKYRSQQLLQWSGPETTNSSTIWEKLHKLNLKTTCMICFLEIKGDENNSGKKYRYEDHKRNRMSIRQG